MATTLSYTKALMKIAFMERKTNLELNAFDRSTILALLFDKPKEETLDDILDARQKLLK